MTNQLTRSFLQSEALSLLSRLSDVQPFSLSMPMVAAASVSNEAFRAVSNHLALNSRMLKNEVRQFLQFLHSAEATQRPDSELQARFSTLKLRFNAILDQFDIFADVISQRAEHRTGVWVAGLDVLASDALQLDAQLYRVPPVMCFLERGHGAAIRKARTRLPGGDDNPVAIIQVPRERMVGSGIAASLIHEVGHQGAALLDLVITLRTEMRSTPQPPQYETGWTLLNLWLSEIIADFWAMAHLGIGATQGLMSVVSLPRYFMFRVRADDPHPFPWIRVALSLAFGERLFPNEQWASMRQLWHRLYPKVGLNDETARIVASLEGCTPAFVELVIAHRNAKTGNQPLASLFPIAARQPPKLRQLYQHWQKQPEQLPLSMPSLVFAAVGQARADSQITAPNESRLLGNVLTQWAWMRAESRPQRTSSPRLLRAALQTFIQ